MLARRAVPLTAPTADPRPLRLAQFWCNLSPLAATLMSRLVCVANKELAQYLSPLPATLTKNTPGGRIRVHTEIRHSPLARGLKPFSFISLRTLSHTFASPKNSTLSFSSDSALFAQNTGGGGTPPNTFSDREGKIRERISVTRRRLGRSESLMPNTTTNKGLHDFAGERVLARYAHPGVRAADLGAGPGAMAERLRSLGCDVVAVDRDANGFEAQVPHVSLDFDQADFASQIGAAAFGLVTAIEVIEHVESPIGFLRNVGRLIAPGGVAVLTTPNVDSLAARCRFILKGKIRTMDEHGEPTHISPVFLDLLRRQFLPRAGLRLREHLLFPPNGYQLTRRPLALTLRLASVVFPGEALMGDNHIFVVEAGS